MRVLVGALGAIVLTACGAWTATPTADETRRVPLPWVLYAVEGVDGDQLAIAVLTGDPTCFGHLAQVDAVESEEVVEILAWSEVSPASSPAACLMILIYEPVTVILDAPLGDRLLTGCMIEKSGQYKTRENCAEIVPNH